MILRRKTINSLIMTFVKKSHNFLTIKKLSSTTKKENTINNYISLSIINMTITPKKHPTRMSSMSLKTIEWIMKSRKRGNNSSLRIIMKMRMMSLPLISEQKRERNFNPRGLRNQSQIKMHIMISKKKIHSNKMSETKKRLIKFGIEMVLIAMNKTTLRKIMSNHLLVKLIRDPISTVHHNFMGIEKIMRRNRLFRSLLYKISLIIMKSFAFKMSLRMNQKPGRENRGKMCQATMSIPHKSTLKW